MDVHRFDDLTRFFGTGMPRRRLAKAVAAFGVAGALTRHAVRPVVAQRDPILEKCTECNQYCDPNSGCYNLNSCNRCKPVKTIAGVVGAGAVRLEAGTEEAYLAVMSTRLGPADPEITQILGQVEWVDPVQPRTLASRRILDYGPLPGAEERGRQVVGLARVSQVEGDVPFVLRVVVADPAGAEASTVQLVAGDAALESVTDLFEEPPAASGFDYEAEGELSSGGLELLRIEFA